MPLVIHPTNYASLASGAPVCPYYAFALGTAPFCITRRPIENLSSQSANMWRYERAVLAQPLPYRRNAPLMRVDARF